MDINKLVLTGATSSIGVAIIDECIKQEIEVLAIVNPGSVNIKSICKHRLVTIVECSLADYRSFEVENGYNDYDAFVHLAWKSTKGEQARNIIIPQTESIEYSLDAVELAKKLGCKVFIGAGSQAEYGRTNETLSEKTIAKPENPYGMAKLCAGQMTRYLCAQKGIRHIWTRILSAYGPNSQPQTVLNYMICELMQGRKPSLSGGDQVWDFIYTGDVARAFLHLAKDGHDKEIYVIGSGESRKLKEYLIDARTILGEVFGKDLPELGLGEKSYTDTTVMHLSCDISKLERDTGFVPMVSFEEGIKHTIKWLKGSMT